MSDEIGESVNGTCRRSGCDWPVEFDGDQCIAHEAEDWVRSRETGTDRSGGDDE